MTRLLCVLAAGLVMVLLPVGQIRQIVRASGGNNAIQTVALHRQSCTTTTMGPVVGTARFSTDDQGGEQVNPNGIEIRISVTAGMPRSSYSALVLGNSCQVLFRGGTLNTDDSGRGDLEFHVLGSVVPPGTRVRVQLVTSTDVITSDPASAT
jgi:hypothetical protein